MISEHHIDYDLRNQRKIRRTPRSVATIGDKIVEILSSNGVTSKNKIIHTPPPIPSWGVCCFLQEAQTAAQHYIEGVGGGWGAGGEEGKLYFSFFKLAKR